MTAFPLRPMDLGDILDASFRIYRERFRLCFLLGLFPSVVLLSLFPVNMLVVTMNSRGLGLWEVLVAILVYVIAIFALALILGALTIAAITHLVSEQFLGRTLRFSHLLPVVKRCFARVVWATLIFMGLLLLVLVGLIGLGIVAFFFALQQTPLLGPTGMVLFVLCIVCLAAGVGSILYLVLSFLLVSQVIVIEDLPTFAAIARSRKLIMTQSAPGFFNHPVQRAGMLLIIVMLIQGVISGIGQIPANAAAFFTLKSAQISAWSVFIIAATTLFHVLANALVTPVSTIVLVMFYYDLRIRAEGLDLEIMARRLREHAAGGENAPAAVGREAQVWPL